MEMANAAQDGERVPNVMLSLLTRMRCVFCISASNANDTWSKLRQIALYPGLVPADYLNELKLDKPDNFDNAPRASTISPQEKARLQSILFHAEEDNEEVCFSQCPLKYYRR